MRRSLSKGFTIVELLIVVVVIAILAAITIVAYNGIRLRAETSALESDITTTLKKLELERNAETGTYDATILTPYIDTSHNGITTKFRYATENSICIEATNQNDLTYFIDTRTSSQPQEGTCSLPSGVLIDPRCIASQAYVYASQPNYTAESLLMNITTSTSGGTSPTTISAGSSKTAVVTNHTASFAQGVVTFSLSGINGSDFSAVHMYPYDAESC